MNKKEIDDLYLTDLDQTDSKSDTPYVTYHSDSEKTYYAMHNTELDTRNIQGEKRNRRHRIRMRSVAAVVAGIIIGFSISFIGLGVATVSSKAESSEADYLSKLDMILNYLKVYYLNDIDDEMIETAIAKGLMENIGDKYAEYYTPEEFDDMLEEMQGEYAGIGVQIVMNDDGFVEVYKVYEGSPAQEAGIQIKDLIVEAGGVREFEKLDDLVAIVRGEPGTTVDLVVERNGEEIPMTIERRTIEIISIYSTLLNETTGYIQIAEFNTTGAQQFINALNDLLDKGITSVIMDLRDDPGGDYDAVVAMCDRVLPEGPIVSVEDKLGGISTDNSDAECIDIPVVLLVNENTASAAELFTMALHDYDMAQIVGTQTYGKGIVQSIFQLIDGSGLKFTTEKYYGPAGNCIQDTGIEPDYVVEIPEEAYEDGVIVAAEDLQLQKAAELLGITLEYDEEGYIVEYETVAESE